MGDLIVQTATVPAMTSAAIQKIVAFEKQLLAAPQLDCPVQSVIHAGVYSRTLLLPAGFVLTGALIKIPTQIVVSGDVVIWMGGISKRFTGYHILAGEAGRKQAMVAIGDTWMTMMFATVARTEEEAEDEFTDEATSLQTRRINK